MKFDTLAKIALTHLSHARSGLAVIVLSCFVIVLGAKEAVADGEAWAALKRGGVFVLMRHGTAEPRNVSFPKIPSGRDPVLQCQERR